MQQFFVANIDALITTAGGMYFTIYFYVKRESLAVSGNPLSRQLPKLAPVLLLFGLLLFFLPDPADEVSAPASTEEVFIPWTEILTDDGVAKAEFPGLPKKDLVQTPVGDFTIQRLTHVLDLANGQLNFRLSFSEHVPGTEQLTDQERLASMKESFTQGGFEIVNESVDPQGIHLIVLEHKGKNARVVMRVAFTSKGTYRVISASLAESHLDERIERFLESFSIDRTRH